MLTVGPGMALPSTNHNKSVAALIAISMQSASQMTL